MMKDPIDFVRQGAFIALSMICIQQNKTQTPKVETIRKALQTVVTDKHEDSLAKFGAAISQGIIDAGGRNVTISMQSKAGTPHMSAIVGMALFTQFWYWFPLAHCLSLSFQPTAIIGLDASLKVSDAFDRYPMKSMADPASARVDAQIRFHLSRKTFRLCVPCAVHASRQGDCRKGQDGRLVYDRSGECACKDEGKGEGG